MSRIEYVEYFIYGWMAFSAVCLLTFLWFARNATPVDDNDYPIKAKVIPFPARDRKQRAA